jgi:hypothetical protein
MHLRILGVSTCVLCLLGTSAIAQTNVTTHHNDSARTGAVLTETVLNTTNVNVSQFGKLFERAVDDEIYVQPLYVAGVNIPGIGVRNVVYVATNNDSVYAFDADTPSASAPLWRVNFTNPAAGIVPVSHNDVGQMCGTYNDFAGNIGIVATPALDPAAQTIYVVAKTKENGNFVQRLHALDIRTGAERPNSPVVIQASVTGTGDGRDAQGNIAFNARTQNQRAGLLLDRGNVYIAFASHCDQGPYHGWVLGYDASSLQQTLVYNATPDGGLGGIWHSGGGIAADPDGFLYVITGNGSFNADSGGRNYGTSFVKLNPLALPRVADWFTPYNWSFLNGADEDLMQNPLLVPGTNLVVGGGKEGVMYVLNRTNMGHLRSNDNNQIVQSFQASSAGRMNGSPVYWSGSQYGPAIYLWAAGDPLKVFRLVSGRFQTPASAQSTVLAPGGMPGGMLSLSANGTSTGTGIVWAALSRGGDANQSVQPGIVRAYDAGNVTRELWNSQQNATRDSLGNFSKFSPPTVANGKVYVASLSNKLVVYGLLGLEGGNTAPVVTAGDDQTVTMPAAAALVGSAKDDGNPTPSNLTATWTLATGPGPVTFGNASAFSTSAAFLVPGVYTLRLSVFDGAATGSDDVVVTVVNSGGAGTGLLAQYFNDAGNGTYFTSLALTRTDPIVDFDWASSAPGAGVQADNFSVRWTGQVQAPVTGTYTFTTASDDGIRLYVNNQLIINNWTIHGVVLNNGTASLVAGQRYDLRLEFYDATSLATARLLWSYPGQAQQVVPQSLLFGAAAVNQPPAVNAGSDGTIVLPGTAALNGTAVDDGLPSPPNLTIAWSKISGREDSAGGTVIFANPNAPTTTASFGADGVYVLRLTVSDGAVTVSDDVTITVNAAPSPGSGTGLLGQYFSDPNNGSHFVTPVKSVVDPTVDFDWASGSPAGVPADNYSTRWTGQVQAPVSGSYTFRTSADDGIRLWIGNQLVIDNWVDQGVTTRTSAPMTLTAGSRYDIRLEYYEHTGLATARLLWSYPGQAYVAIPASRLFPSSVPSNTAPVVNAGADQTISLSAAATLSGSVTDDLLPAPSQITISWSRVSGPGTVTFSAPNAANTTATFSQAGSYVLRLTASDGPLSSSDDVSITVTTPPAGGTNGLTAQYFNDPGTGSRFTTLVLTRVDQSVDFNWGSSAPAPSVGSNNYSVRWTGFVEAPVTGTYVFSTVSDDGIRLWVNGQQVINNWTIHGATTNTSAGITLTAGVRYTIRLDYFEATGLATARLRWSYPGQTTQAIPATRLFQ